MKMQAFILLIFASIPGYLGFHQNLFDGEKSKAIEYLESSLELVVEQVKNLSAEQLEYSPTEQTWSVRDVVGHLVKVEGVVMGRVLEVIKSGEISNAIPQISDEELIEKTANRDRNGQKFQAPEVVQPFDLEVDTDKILETFVDARKNTIAYLKSTDTDLRKVTSKHPVIGQLDAHQWCLFVAAHTERHSYQIGDITTGEFFPVQ